MASARFYLWTAIVIVGLMAATDALAATVYNTGPDSPQDRTPSFNPIHQLNLFTLNKFPISVDTVKACGQNADAETRIYCALKESVPGLLDKSQGGVNVKVRIGSADLQTISRTPKPMHPAKGENTAETYGFESDGEQYNAIFLDQGTLYVYVGEPSADVAVALIRHLMDEGQTLSLNQNCIIRTSANAKALVFKNCQVLDAQKPPASSLQYQKIQCDKPAKTGIIGLTSAINGQCPQTVPQSAASGLAGRPNAASNPTTEEKKESTECSIANFVSPIDNPEPRVDSLGDYFWGSTRKTSGHHEGVDIKGQDGSTPVKAAGAGMAEDYKTTLCGNGLMINHGCTIDGKPFRTKYCHLSSKNPIPKTGTQLTQGQIIGLVGRTGNIQHGMVSHLHVEYMAGGRFENNVFLGGDFDPVEKGFMPKSFGIPGKTYEKIEILNPTRLQFAGVEALPTVKEYFNLIAPGNRYETPNPTCDNNDGDENGFFGWRRRGQYDGKTGIQRKGGCVHFGVDLRGNTVAGGLYDRPVKAMMSGKIVRIKKGYQGTAGKNDYLVVVQSGDWKIAYGHLRFSQQKEDTTPQIREGDLVTKGQILGYPHHEIQKPYDGELHINVLYEGNNPELQKLTVKKMRDDQNYAKQFKDFDTRAISKLDDFTFLVTNYDNYFIWEKYTAALKSSTAVVPDQTATAPSAGPTVPSTLSGPAKTTSDGTPMSDVCVYYYLDVKDGAKDAFFDAGIAAYAGPGGACLVGRAALSRSDIQYPAGYSGYVSVNQLPAADSYEGCYVAKVPLNKHGDKQPTGVNVKLFLSKNQAAFAASEGYLEKGIARSLADEKTIGKLACLPPVAVKLTPKDSSEAGKKFLEFAMELKGLPYPSDLNHVPELPKETDCATIPTYAYAKMLQAGYTLPQEFYDTMKKEKVKTPEGITVKNPVKDWLSPISNSITMDLATKKKINIPAGVSDLSPHNSDTWGGLLEVMGWEVPLSQVQPGDIAVFTYSNGGQCSGTFSEDKPYGTGGLKCWKNEGHIEVIHSGSGSSITTFGSDGPSKIKGPNQHDQIYKAFRIPWIAPGQANNPQAASLATGKRIAISAGHDKCPSGTTINGKAESVVVLEFAKALETELKTRGAQTYMVRKDQEPLFEKKCLEGKEAIYLELGGRSRLISENADIAIELHVDQPSGLPAAYYCASRENAPEQGGGYKYGIPRSEIRTDTSVCQAGQKLASAIASTLGPALEGETGQQVVVKKDDYDPDRLKYGHTITRRSNIPVALVELGTGGNQKLLQPTYQKKLAKAVADGLEKHLGGFKAAAGGGGSGSGSGIAMQGVRGPNLASACPQYDTLFEKYIEQNNAQNILTKAIVGGVAKTESNCNHDQPNKAGLLQVYECISRGGCSLEENINLGVKHLEGDYKLIASKGITGKDAWTLVFFSYNRGKPTADLAIKKIGSAIFSIA